MQVTISLLSDAARFRDLESAVEVLDVMERRFRASGATRFVVTGLPMPGRPLMPLVLRASWGERRQDRNTGPAFAGDDPVIQAALQQRRPFYWPNCPTQIATGSALIPCASEAERLKVVGVPVTEFMPYQGCVFATVPEAGFAADQLTALSKFCSAAFARLFDLNALRRERPGDLSARERRVIELSAIGKTASEIAEFLQISQRTVHAHLQNASDKLRARNKTHTVIEALRYGQIAI